MITFVVPVGDIVVYEKCFLSSPLFKGNSTYQIIEQKGYSNAGLAFNNGIDRSENDTIVFVHQDVMLPKSWDKYFLSHLNAIEDEGLSVGVVGCMGVTWESKPMGHFYRHNKEIFRGNSFPAEVQTLDEMLISFRKSTGLRFDSNLPNFFFYGMDICLQSVSVGLKNYVIDAPCFHQAKNRNNILPDAYWKAYRYVLKKWDKRLPIFTNSGPITGYGSYYKRRMEELINRIGFPHSPWWKDLPEIDPDKIMNGNE